MNRETQVPPRTPVPARRPATVEAVESESPKPVKTFPQMIQTADVSWPVLAGWGVLLTAFVWTYWPTLQHLAHAWNVEPDYSHGYFVIPLAIAFLWLRRDRMPQPKGPGWAGLTLIGLSFAVHILGSYYYLDALHGWSIALWCAGAAWLFGGGRFCLWALPSAAFLVFMTPLPARFEGMLSRPLQRVSTEISCWGLQSLGLPALAEGNVIMIDDIQLEVAQACSGLRIFVSIVALAFAYCVLVRRPWWMKGLLVASVIPIAVLANSVRVALIGITYPYATTAAAHQLLHDVAGWLVIPLAAAMMGALIWYLGRLFVQVQPMTGRELLKS